MNQHEQTCQQLHAAFLERWPLEAVRNMTLEEYSSIGNPDTYCAWLERHTKTIGVISGHYASMFEIYARSPHNPPPNKKNVSSDGQYSWFNRHGATREAAFENIKAKVLQIIEMAGQGDLEGIERLEHFTPKVRWKIAFLYAPVGSMVAVFVPGKLSGIGQDLGLRTQSVAALHHSLSTLKPADQGIYDFSADLYHRTSRLFSARNRQYYVVGTKYGPHATESRFQEMSDLDVVSTDFGPPGLSLHEFYLNANKQELREHLEDAECPDLDNATNNLFTFLNIRVGDIIALKDAGNPKGGSAYLKIIAYAVVVERGGIVYRFDEQLGHCLHVEYVNAEVNLELEQGGYGKTVSPVENLEARQRIFRAFFGATDTQLVRAIEETAEQQEQQERQRRRRRGVRQITPRGGVRRATGPAVINPRHQMIQSELLAFLQQQSPDADINAEEDFIDISVKRNNALSVDLYEIKPYCSAKDCIRASLGQLMDYARWEQNADGIRLIAVGPTAASTTDQAFVAYIQEHLKLPFEYKSWPADFITT